MKYSETLSKIHSLNKFGSRPGLERIKKLLSLLGEPQDTLSFVHIAGTNGKGSVSQMISSVLTESGYRTGLFISPFITDFCERIQINNCPISHDDLCSTAEYVFSKSEILNNQGIIITEFEFVMAVAFEYFKNQGVDVVVLETGLGGRLDCTNVIKPPLCSVLTRIGLDHTDILGDTVEKIAEEKCGIIKSGSKVVSSQQLHLAEKVIRKTCNDRGVSLDFASSEELKVRSATLEGTEFECKGLPLRLNLLGEHQLQNASVALKALEVLKEQGFTGINRGTLANGFSKAVNPARFEVMSYSPVVILDGAHNADGMSTFANAVKNYCGDKKGVLIMGMLADKDSKSSLEFISGLFKEVHTVPINNPRALSSQEMAELCSQHFDFVKPHESVEEAFDEAFEKAKREDLPLLVCGSLYLAGELRPYILSKVIK